MLGSVEFWRNEVFLGVALLRVIEKMSDFLSRGLVLLVGSVLVGSLAVGLLSQDGFLFSDEYRELILICYWGSWGEHHLSL